MASAWDKLGIGDTFDLSKVQPKLKLTDDVTAAKSSSQTNQDTVFDRPGFVGDVARSVADTGLGYMTAVANLYNNLTQAQHRDGGTPIQDKLIKAHNQLSEIQDSADKATMSPIDYATQKKASDELAAAKGIVDNVKAGGKSALNMLMHPIDNSGKIVGGIFDPLNFVPASTGLKVAEKLGGGIIPKVGSAMVAGAASNAPVNAVEEGSFAAARGEDWQKAAESGFGGGAVGGAILGGAAPLIGGASTKIRENFGKKEPISPSEVIDAPNGLPYIKPNETIDTELSSPQVGYKNTIYANTNGWSENLGQRIQGAIDAKNADKINGIVDAEVQTQTQNKLIEWLNTQDIRTRTEAEQINAQTQDLLSQGADAKTISNALDNIITPTREDVFITAALNGNKPLPSRMMGTRLLPLLENSISTAEKAPNIARTNQEFFGVLKSQGVNEELASVMTNAYAAKDPSILQKYMWDKIHENRAAIVDESAIRSEVEQKVTDAIQKESEQIQLTPDIAREKLLNDEPVTVGNYTYYVKEQKGGNYSIIEHDDARGYTREKTVLDLNGDGYAKESAVNKIIDNITPYLEEKNKQQYQNNSDIILNNSKGAEHANDGLERINSDIGAKQTTDERGGADINSSPNEEPRVGAQTTRDNAEPTSRGERGADGNIRDARQSTSHDSSSESLRGRPETDIAGAKEQVGGLQTDRVDEGSMGRGNSTDGLVSTKANDSNMGAAEPLHEQATRSNLDLRDKKPIELTPSSRKKANAAAEEVLKKPIEDMTEADREILRQHTGDGGIDGATGEGIFNQHYTSYDVIRSMYKALADSGFEFKTALEPAVGSGNFVGHAPKIKWDIVDIDPKNIEISKRLYPETNYAHVGSFETFKGSGYDLIISNVPFASYAALPREHAHKIQPNYKAIHNFYFAHAIDKVKDDGIVAFITSTGTMDGTGEAAKLRAHLMEKADLVGAYRLPQKSFSKNASTDVMADVIFLQKRPKGVEPRESVKEANTLFEGVTDKEGYPINSYFAEYPNKVLGELVIDRDKTKMGKEGWIAKGKANLEAMKVDYEPYIKNEKAQAQDVKEPSVFRDRDELMAYADENSIKVATKKGLFFEPNEDGALIPWLADKKVEFSMTDGEAFLSHRVDGGIGDKLQMLEQIREAINSFQRTEDKGNSEYAKLAAERYVKEYGDITTDTKLKAYLDKHKSSGLFLDYKHMFGDDGKLAVSATERVRFANSGKIEANINSPLKLRAEYHEDSDGIINISTARLLSEKDIQTLIKDGYAIIEENGKMAIQNPAIYYTGHLYSKILRADALIEAKKYDTKVLESQIQTLKANYPEAKPYSQIEFIGNEQFMADPRIQAALAVKESYLKNASDARLYDKALKGESLITKGKDESMDDYLSRLKEANDTLKNIIIPAAREHLKNSGVAELVEERYNNYLNSYREPKFDGSSLTDVPPQFRGKPLKLLGYQSEGAERIVFNKKGVIAFAPGGGKTITAVVAVRHLMNKGAVKKPVYVVPANTIAQWKDTIRELYPDTKIKEFAVNKSGKYKGQEKQWSNLSPVEKHEALYDIAHNNYDATVVSYEMFNDIMLPEKDFEKYIDDFARAIREDMQDDTPSKGAKADEKERIKNEKVISLLKQKFRDTRATKSHLAITLDQLGFDSIIVDEAHNFKNIGYKGQIVDANLGTNIELRAVTDNITGEIVDAVFGGWQTYDMRFKTSFISERNNNNNIIMLTGTPTPNKPMELATILQHLDINLLKEYGFRTPAEFANTFFEIEKKEAGKQDGSKDAKNTYSAVKNLSTLHAIKDRYINYLDYDQMPGLVRPEAVWTEHVILQGDAERHIAEDILYRLKKAKEAAKKRFQGGAKDGEAIGAVYFSGKDAGTDRRFYFSASTAKHSALPDNIRQEIMTKETDPKYSKIAKTVELVAEQRAANDKAGQIIFIDRQTANGANIHQEIKSDLIATGKFKPEEIGIANGTQVTNHITGKEGVKTDANRQALVDAFNAGKVKVIIGTTNSLGVGVDLQKHTTDIYNIDIPWTADEMSQRINRGVRQGNENSKVRVHTFFQMGSYDRLVLGIVQKKIGFNDIFWKQKDKSVSRVEIPPYVAPDYHSLALELETNPVKKQALIVERDFDELTRNIKEVGDLAQAEDAKYKAKIHWVENEIPTEIRGLENRKNNPELPKYENIKDEAERAAKIEEYKAKYISDIESRIDKKRADIETLKAEAEMIKAKYDARVEKKVELEAKRAELIEGYMKPTRDGYTVDFDKIGERMDKIEDIYNKEEC